MPLAALASALLFAAVWLGVGALLCRLSGWFALRREFPDQDETAFLELSGQSGWMGKTVNINGVLRLAACPTGLRVGISRVFAPFAGPFLVPWKEISVERRKRWLMPVAELKLGETGRLGLHADVADRLWRAAPGRWPEAGAPPAESDGAALLRRFAALWALQTGVVAALLVIVPRLVAPPGARPPVAVAVLFPAVVFALAYAWEYGRRRE